jgi:DNA-binding winged helix-turn-helix (wHTH) protein
MRGGEQHKVVVSGTDAVVIDGESGVAILGWPECESDLEDLARRGVPRLLLVAPTVTPPVCTDCLEDWVRLPVDETDLRARMHTLAERQRIRQTLTVDENGILRQDNTVVLLSPTEQRIAAVLIEHFGALVAKDVIEQRLWNELDPSSIAMRVHISRLRKRVAPLGLKISSVHNFGYVLHRDQTAPSDQVASRSPGRKDRYKRG